MAEWYDTDRFAALFAASQAPPIENLGLAGRYIDALFEKNDIYAAFLGGWAMTLRGGGRSTNDVDMTVRTTMANLIGILSPQPQLSIPLKYGATSIQVFVHTGGDWNPGYTAIPVSVDIIIEGHLGAPMNLLSGTESISPIHTTQGNGPVRVLDLRHQFAAKLAAFFTRQSENDYLDLNFLFTTDPTAIKNFSHQLDLQHRQYYAEAYASRNSPEPEWGNYVRQTLGL